MSNKTSLQRLAAALHSNAIRIRQLREQLAACETALTTAQTQVVTLQARLDATRTGEDCQ